MVIHTRLDPFSQIVSTFTMVKGHNFYNVINKTPELTVHN